MDRQCMHAAGKLTGKCLIDHAVPFDPALSPERLRHDMNPEMGLPAWTMAGVPLVSVRLIDHVQALRRKRGG